MAAQLDIDGLIDVNSAAKLLNLDSTRRVQQLVKDGWIEKDENGKYRTFAVVHGYIAFLKDGINSKNQNVAENRVKAARAQKLEMENARADHEVVELDEATSVVDELTGMLKSEFNGFPAAMTRDHTMRRKLESGIDDIFARAYARVLETLKALGESGVVVETDAEDDT